MVGPPMAGSVYDATLSYDVSFYLAGGFLIIASAISFGAQILQNVDTIKKKDPNSTEKVAEKDQSNDPAQLY